MKRSLYATLIFWYIVISLVPILIIVPLSFKQRNDMIKQRESDKLIAIRDLKAAQINSWIIERQFDVRYLTNELNTLLRSDSSVASGGFDEHIGRLAAGMLNRFLQYNPVYQELFIVDLDKGNIVFSTETDYQGLNKSASPYYLKNIKPNDIFFTDIYYSKKLGNPTLCFSGALIGYGEQAGKSIGILVMRIDLGISLFRLLSDSSVKGMTGEIILINKSQLVLCPLRLRNFMPLTLTDKSRASAEAAAGNTGVIEADDYRQEAVIAAYTYLPAIGWGLIVKQDFKEIYHPVKKFMLNISLLIVLFMLLFMVIAILLARSVSRPIVEMSRVSQKIMDGELLARHKSDVNIYEIDLLASSFNAMTDSLVSGMMVQKGVAEVNQILVWTSRLDGLRSDLLKRLMHVTGSRMGAYYVSQQNSDQFSLFTSYGIYPQLTEGHTLPIAGLLGDILQTRKITRIGNIPENTIFTYKTFVGDIVPKEILAVPVIVDDEIMAIITMATIYGYSAEHLSILEQLWPGINAVASNFRAAEEIKKYAGQLELKNKELEIKTLELEAQTHSLTLMSKELRRRNQMLEFQQQKIEEADRLKTEFLSNMSHELRTPLNSILALSRVIKLKTGPKLDEEEVKYIDIIERNGKLLLELINDILDLAKIETGKVELNRKLTSVSQVLAVIIERLMPLGEQKGIKIVFDDDVSVPEIETDQARLNQIFQNIIGNAVKFTERGQVDISLKLGKKNIYVVVTDTGIGIPEKDLPYIFEAFRQVDGSSSRNYEGTGLGLAIASKSAMIIGGGISVESREGLGSVFTIRLPLQAFDQLEEECVVMGIKPDDSCAESSDSQKNYLETPKKLLLIEDNPSSMLMIKSLLEKKGYTVDTATDGLKAMDYLRKSIPDAIVLDLIIPGIDGFEVLRYVRLNEASRDIPVLIITAKDINADEQQKLLHYQANRILHKSKVDEQHLLESLKGLFTVDVSALPPASDLIGGNRIDTQEQNSSLSVDQSRPFPLVLAVEDNPDNMIALKSMISDQYEVIEAGDGLKGIEQAVNYAPDLILLDMALPGLDGLSVVRKLKNNPLTDHIPIIALTAYAMKGDREKFLAAGCDDYVAKPIEPELLLQVMEQRIRKRSR